MSSVTDDTTSDKGIAPKKDESEAAPRSRRPRRRPPVSAKQIKAGSDAVRNRIASVIWIVAVICAVVLALAALLTALDQANQQNSVVQWLTDTADVLAGPLAGPNGSPGIFDFSTDAKDALANWGVAALAYLIIGRVVDRIIRP
jgi:hypothetical protein